MAGAPAAARRGATGRSDVEPKQTAKNRYAAVRIEPMSFACDAVMRYTGRRILVSEAPVLPVPGCTEKTCQCRFVKYSDRRSGSERRLPFGEGSMMFILGQINERRETRDRRTDESESDSRSYFDDEPKR